MTCTNMARADQADMVDGGRAWLVVMATFTIHLVTHGLIFSFGLLFAPLEEKFHGSKGEIAWIGSLMTGTMYLGGPVAGQLSARFGYRRVAVGGALLGCLGYSISVVVPDLHLLYLTMGLVTGTGFSLLYQPAVVSVTQAFRKHRTLACGLSSCGSGIGAFLFSPLQKFLLDTYSWHGTLLIDAGIILNCIPCGLMLYSFNTTHGNDVNSNRKSFKKSHEIHEIEVKSKLLTYENDKDRRTELSNDCENNIEMLVTIETDRGLICKTKYQDNNEVSAEEAQEGGVHRRPRWWTIFKVDVFKRPEFLLYAVSQFMFFLGQYIPFIYTPVRLKTIGIPDVTSVWVISTIGISSISSRILLGYIADRLAVNRTRMFATVLLIGGVSTVFADFYHSVPLLFLYAALFGICLGTGVTLISVVLVDLIGMDGLNEAFGMSNLFTGLGTLLGPPLAGFLFDRTQSYSATFMTAGIAFLIGGVCLFVAPAFPRAHGSRA